MQAVNRLDLDLDEGEILGVVGETGSGKSVTALSVLRLVPLPGKIVSGRIIFRGEDLLTKTQEEMKEIRGNLISMIFQDPRASLNPVFKVGEQLVTAYRAHARVSKREAAESALEMMSAVGMPDPEAQMEAYPHQLSGGMCQRVMIAVALMCEPKLLIADEATTALDVTVQAEVLDLVVQMVRSKQASCLYITHDMGVVAQTCDRVAVLYCGGVVETGTVIEIFDDASHPYTQGLIASTLRVDRHQRLTVIGGDVPDAARLPPGCSFHPRCQHARQVCQEVRPKVVKLGPGRTASCHKVTEGW